MAEFSYEALTGGSVAVGGESDRDAVVHARDGATAAAPPAIDVQAALKTVAPDLDQRLVTVQAVRMPYNGASLSARERQMVDQLVHRLPRARKHVLASERSGRRWHSTTRSTAVDTPLARRTSGAICSINGSRWDLVDENRPFVGSDADAARPRALSGRPDARADRGVRGQRIPTRRPTIYNPYTIVHRQGATLVGRDLPRRVQAVRRREAAAALRQAAALSDDPAFARFLRLRAEALLTDDYYDSDIAWLDLKNPKFDVIFAPYETYLDDLLGVKTSYGASILIRNDAESQKLAEVSAVGSRHPGRAAARRPRIGRRCAGTRRRWK